MYSNFNLIMVNVNDSEIKRTHGPAVFSLEIDRKVVFSGSLNEVAKIMVNGFDFYIEEIEAGIETMIENDHDLANFGVNRNFIFSSKRKVA